LGHGFLARPAAWLISFGGPARNACGATVLFDLQHARLDISVNLGFSAELQCAQFTKCQKAVLEPVGERDGWCIVDKRHESSSPFFA
jgi:hypothetical protein